MIEQALIRATAVYIAKGRVPAPASTGDTVEVKPGRRKGRNVKGYTRRKPKRRVPGAKPGPAAPGEGNRTATAQNVLRVLGHAGETLPEAVADFQKKNKLEATGHLDPKTMDAMRKKIAGVRRKRRKKRKKKGKQPGATPAPGGGEPGLEEPPAPDEKFV